MVDILISPHVFYPDIPGTAKVTTDIARVLGEYYKVKVISQNRAYNDPKIIYNKYEIIGQVSIERYDVPNFNKNSNLQRLILSGLVAQRAKQYALKEDAKVYMAVSNPQNMAYQVAKVAKQKGRPFVYLLHDLYPEVMEKTGHDKGVWRYINAYIKHITKKIFDMSDIIIVIGRDAREYVISNYNVEPERIRVITNWGPEENNIDKERVIEYKQRKGWMDKFIVLYSGNIGQTADFEVLLKAAKEMENIDKDILFVIVGNGRKKTFVRDTIINYNIKNTILLDFVPDDEYINMINSADCLFVSLRKELYGISVPSKTYYYLSAGKPIIGVLPPNSEVVLEMMEDGFGVPCTDYSHETLIEAILGLKNDSEKYNLISQNARKAFENKYRKSIVVKQYVELFKELL